MSDTFTFIDSDVAIGNYKSSYDPFDVIVNLNYPYNNVIHNTVDSTLMIYNYNEKILLRVGCNDIPEESENFLKFLEIVIEKLRKIKKINPDAKILFHCYAGISRSSSMAIGYLCKVKGLSLKDSYNMAKSKRPIIRPNDGFIETLKKYCNKK